MTLTADDLLEPKGELDATVLFPDAAPVDVKARLTSYLDTAADELGSAGVDSARVDRGARVYAYHRAYQALFLRLSANPTTKSLTDQGSLTYSMQQLVTFDTLSKQYRAEYDAILESGLAPTQSSNVVAHTTTIPTQFTY